MLALGMLSRAGARRGWASGVVLALLVAVVVAVVLGSAAGARRSVSVVDRLLDEIEAADVEIQLTGEVDALAAVGELDDLVGARSGILLPFFAPDGTDLLPGIDFHVAVPAADGVGEVDLPLLRDGRLPDPRSADEVTINSLARDRLGLGVGDRVLLRSFTEEQFDAVLSGGRLPERLDGPTAEVVVVGVADSRQELLLPEQFGPGMWSSPAFAEQIDDGVPSFGPLVLARLRVGVEPGEVSAALAELEGLEEPPDVVSASEPADQARGAGRFQAGGLLVLGAVVAVGGALLVAQAVGRQLQVAREDEAALVAIGLTGRQRRAVAAAPIVMATSAGSVLGVLAAAALSGLFPLGSVRALEPSPGFGVDGLVLGVGGVVSAVALAGTTWWRAGRTARQRAAARPAILDAAVRTSSPQLDLGVHFAFGRRITTRPVRIGVLGVAVAAGGMAAAAVFGSSLDELRETPRAYGWNWDSEVVTGDDPGELAPVIDDLRDDARVGAISTARIVGTTTVADRDVQGFAFEAVEGEPMFLTLLEGRRPSSDEEVVLGPLTASRADVGVGDAVDVRDRRGGSLRYQVVGIAIFPVLESDTYRDGAAFTLDGLDRARTADGYTAVLVDWDEGQDVGAIEAELREQGLGFDPGVPPAVDNLDEVSDFPFVVAGLFGVLGATAFVHAVVTGARHRREELAVLATLGLRRRQLAGAIAVQSVLLGVAGLASGLLLGTVAGRLAWRAMAESLEVVVATTVPVGAVVATAATVLVVALLAAALSARELRRLRLAPTLRSA